jgi:hypothetical protein
MTTTETKEENIWEIKEYGNLIIFKSLNLSFGSKSYTTWEDMSYENHYFYCEDLITNKKIPVIIKKEMVIKIIVNMEM